MSQVASFVIGTGAVWAIPVFLFIHELEEWNILQWYKMHFNNLPKSTNTSIRIHIVTIGMAGFLLTTIAFISPMVVKSILIIFLSGFVLTNTIQHIIQTFQHKAYAPGLSTAIICTTACVYANIMLVQNRMILVPLYVLILFGIPTIVKTVRSKHEMTPEIRRLHEFFIRIANCLRPHKG